MKFVRGTYAISGKIANKVRKVLNTAEFSILKASLLWKVRPSKTFEIILLCGYDPRGLAWQGWGGGGGVIVSTRKNIDHRGTEEGRFKVI